MKYVPYILKELRPFHDELITKIVLGIENAPDDQLAIWANEFKAHMMYSKPEVFDGEFNYFLTKLFKKLNWIGDVMTYYSYMQTSKKVEKLLMEMLYLYCSPESYFNYNRAIGMLTCCQLELKRRYGTKGVMGTTFLQIMVKKFYEEVAAYEDRKIALNGDV